MLHRLLFNFEFKHSIFPNPTYKQQHDPTGDDVPALKLLLNEHFHTRDMDMKYLDDHSRDEICSRRAEGVR